MKKKTLIIVLIMLICTVVGIKTYKTYMGTEVEEIKKKEKHNNYLTFYVQQDNGSYAEQSGNTFPTGTYQINTSMTKCEDQFGEKVTPSFSMNNGSVTVTSTRTVYCTLYMDKANYTATFNFASETAPLSGVQWSATWTLPNANQYCIIQSSNSSGCSWKDIPKDVNGSFSSSYIFTTLGQQTYYFYVKNESGIMVSANDTIIVTDSAPTCTFSVSNSGGITFTKSDNATKWHVGTSSIDTSVDSNYDNTSTTTFGPGSSKYYGYVKNAAGLGSCTIDMYADAPGCSPVGTGGSGGSSQCYVQMIGCCSSNHGQILSSTQVNSCTSSMSGSCDSGGTCVQQSCNCYGGGGGTTYQCSADQKEYSSQEECNNKCKASSCSKEGYIGANPGNYPLYCYKLS